MLRKLRPRRPSHPTVVAYLALFVALGGTGAYAANEWTGANIVDESLTFADVKGKAGTATTPAVNGALGTHDLAGQPANAANGTPFADGSLTEWDIKNNSLTAADLAPNSVGTSELTNGSVTNAKLAPGKVPDADKLDGVDSSQFQRVGLVHLGTAPQNSTEGNEVVIQWHQLGAAFTTDGDVDTDDTVRIFNFGSQKIEVRYGGSAWGLGPGGSVSINVAELTTFIVWPADGQRSWLVSCVADIQITSPDQIRCHGVASRPD